MAGARDGPAEGERARGGADHRCVALCSFRRFPHPPASCGPICIRAICERFTWALRSSSCASAAQGRAFGCDQAAQDTVLADIPVPQRKR